VSLAESVMAVALVQTSGVVQMDLTYFVTLFPVFVAAAFFVILAFKTWVLYGPWEFRNPTEIAAFKGELSLKPLDTNSLQNLLADKVGNIVQDQVTAERVVKSIQEEFLTIDPSPLLGHGTTPWKFPYKQFDTVQQLLDTIYLSFPYEIRERIPIGSYGKKWYLKDDKSNTIYRDMGRSSMLAKKSNGLDYRGLTEVGIKPSAYLSLIPA
jgi:hypothetical protein